MLARGDGMDDGGDTDVGIVAVDAHANDMNIVCL